LPREDWICGKACWWGYRRSRRAARLRSQALRRSDSAPACQKHKQRNVCEHFGKDQYPYWETKLENAYNLFGYAEAKRALQQIQHELMGVNPSAARSLEEGLEDTLTLHRLRVPESLRKTLRTTNPIESIFSTRFASRVAM